MEDFIISKKKHHKIKQLPIPQPEPAPIVSLYFGIVLCIVSTLIVLYIFLKIRKKVKSKRELNNLGSSINLVEEKHTLNKAVVFPQKIGSDLRIETTNKKTLDYEFKKDTLPILNQDERINSEDNTSISTKYIYNTKNVMVRSISVLENPSKKVIEKGAFEVFKQPNKTSLERNYTYNEDLKTQIEEGICGFGHQSGDFHATSKLESIKKSNFQQKPNKSKKKRKEKKFSNKGKSFASNMPQANTQKYHGKNEKPNVQRLESEKFVEYYFKNKSPTSKLRSSHFDPYSNCLENITKSTPIKNKKSPKRSSKKFSKCSYMGPSKQSCLSPETKLFKKTDCSDKKKSPSHVVEQAPMDCNFQPSRNIHKYISPTKIFYSNYKSNFPMKSQKI